MNNFNFQLILSQPDGTYAIPDIIITADFAAVFSIQNVADISQRKDNLTKNITLPGTKNNDRIFNNLYSLNPDADRTVADTLFFNYSPVIGVRAVLFENNAPIMSGTLTINDIKPDENGAYTYVGIITGKLVTFFGNLKDKLLTDLTGFEDSIPYTWANIQDTWEYGNGLDYIFPSIDYGKGIVPRVNKFELRNFRPGIYARRYIKTILASQGYRYKSNFIDGDPFKRAFIPYSEAEFGETVFGNVATSVGVPYEFDIMRGVQAAYNGFEFAALDSTTFFSLENNVPLQTDGLDNEGHDFDGSKECDVFTIKRFSNVGAVINYNFDIHTFAHSTTFSISVVTVLPNNHFDGRFPVSTQRWNVQPGDGGITVNRTGTLALPFGSYAKGYRFAIIITTTSTGGNVDFTQNAGTGISFTNTDISTGSTFNYELGDTLTLSDFLPKDQKAIDFLKALLTASNMYMLENPADPTELIIEPYDVFYSQELDPASYALDWTKKVDNKTLHKTVNTLLPKTYNFKFKEDKDYYNTLYKNTYNTNYGDFTIDNANGIADAKDLTLTLSATVMVTEFSDDKTMPAIFDGDLSEKKPLKSNLRLLVNNGFAACNAYDVCNAIPGDPVSYNDLITGVTTYNTSHHVARDPSGTGLFNFLFGLPKAVYYVVEPDVFDIPTMFDSFYKNQLEELNDPNIFTLSVDAHLNEGDIQNLDLRTPIFVSTIAGAAYFKVMSVTYFTSQEVSKIVLQKVILT